ncbi:hypothetical protein I6F35_20375 [Bradyrhizobium sp. BRP22]|uniref:hypothetical protein n=1 Tax=Bradyrhizobium sp. BRP22 TaxID=2793821 RepID=UPI001CD53790|nr:hypothetical protein [Bradyrhizobium sp. BRP22]MCA1455535.1 hypothetical protein [Bradyrhizobium sp. BRP22]
MLAPARVDAQWWRSTPRDFEECADIAEKAKTKQEKTSQLADCNAKFAGRRKVGGGYTYYDFLQDRSFDISGPNPTPEEQKKIDQEYARYLEKQRRESMTAALALKQQQEAEAQVQAQQPMQSPAQPGIEKVTLRTETVRVPVPVASPVKQAERIRAAKCAKDSFSCEWPRLSSSWNEFKKIFNSQPQAPSTKAKQRS